MFNGPSKFSSLRERIVHFLDKAYRAQIANRQGVFVLDRGGFFDNRSRIGQSYYFLTALFLCYCPNLVCHLLKQKRTKAIDARETS